MRQKDIDFATALNNIQKRVPEKNSLEDLMLQSCELSIPHTHRDYPVNAMHVYAQNQYCSEWKSICLNTLTDELYSNKAINVAKDKNTNLANIPFPTNPPKTGNIVELFNVKFGAWVMLTTNINVGDGLTNGAMGTVSAVILNRNKRIHAVLVVFDSEKIGVYAKGNSQYKHIDSCAVPVQRIEISISVKNSKHVRVS